MIWLTGCNGMLGTEFKNKMETLNMSFVATDSEVDIANQQYVENFLKNKNIKTIINCAAYTDVDMAEVEQQKAFRINSEGALQMALTAGNNNAALFHFSTDYVFNGEGNLPYYEEDKPNPISVYGKSKWTGEEKVQEICKKYFIFRISWLYGLYGKCFPKTMMNLLKEKRELNVVDDQIGSPTCAKTLAYNVLKIISKNDTHFGIYNYTDLGFISWYEFAVYLEKLAFEYGIIKNRVNIMPIPSSMYRTKAKRPLNSRLDKCKVLKKLDVKLNDWKVNLEKFVSEFRKYEKN